MSPSNASAPAQQPTERRAAPRVVPAIPLSLTKPKAVKAKPRVEANTIAGAEGVPVETSTTKILYEEQEHALPTLNGNSGSFLEESAPQHGSLEGDPVTMPLADTPESRGSAAMSLSFGGTPEMPPTDSLQASTPPPPQLQSPTSTTSPASARKSNNSFDMRPIRTELPPAFVPSAEQHTPKSATSSQLNRPWSSRPLIHPSHPSTNGIIFGSRDSAASSPAPPQSAGSAFMSPTYPNFPSNHQPYFVPQGHTHHASEPFPYRSHHPGYAQPAAPWHGRQTYGNSYPQAPPFHPHAHIPFRYPPRDSYTSTASQHVNGRKSSSRSGSASQASSVAPEQRKAAQTETTPLSPEPPADHAKMMLPPEPKDKFQRDHQPRQLPFHPQMHPPPPPTFQHPDVAASVANAEALREHVLTKFMSGDFSDCQLLITDDNSEHEHVVHGHRAVLSRSPTLLGLIQADKSSVNTEQPAVNVQLSGQYLRTSVLADAIKFLYGGPALQLDFQRPPSAGGEQLSSNVDRMETALQHIATGMWLKVPPIAARGVDVAAGLLHWETIASALTFALDGGLSHFWTAEENSEDRASVTSSDDSLSRAEPATTPTFDPYSTHLLDRIVGFTVHFFPMNFYLDAAAPQLPTIPRLPARPLNDEESRPARSDPRFSQIRFGDVPAEDHQRPSFATTTVSSVLLSLPFSILKCVLEHVQLAARLGPETVASIMRQVIAEREMRRTKALSIHISALANGASTDSQLVHNLYFQESVEPSSQHRAGSRLVRRKREIDTPPSSGACSERNK